MTQLYPDDHDGGEDLSQVFSHRKMFTRFVSLKGTHGPDKVA